MKKVVSIVLCLMFVIGCLAGCTQTTPTTAPTTAPTTKPTTAPTVKPGDPTEAPTEAPTEEPKGVLPLTTEKKTITIGINANQQVENYNTNKYTLWLEEQTGIDLEFVYFSSDSTERTTQLNLMVASPTEKLPDIICGWDLGANLRNELGEDGYLLDLNEYFDKYAYWFWEEYALLGETAQNMIFAMAKHPATGALYAFPGVMEQAGIDSCADPVQINKVWLEKLNLKMPETVQELHDVLVAFRDQDPNGNGKADEIPLIGAQQSWGNIAEFIVNAYIYSNDLYFYGVENGKVYDPYVTDEYREALKVLNQWYAEGLLSPMFFSIKNKSEMQALLTPQDEVALIGVVSYHPTNGYSSNNNLVDEYIALPALKAETPRGGYAPQRTMSYYSIAHITCDAEDPVLCFKLLDYMCSYDNLAHQRYGEEGVDWDWAPESEWSENSFGFPAHMYVHDSNVWSDQNNQCWHNMIPHFWSIARGFNNIPGSQDPTAWSVRRSAISVSIFKANRATGTPKEVIYQLVYTPEENEVYSEHHSSWFDYVKEQRALFISGTLDPNNDTDWDNYLKTLKGMGQEELLQIAQSAYTRMSSK